MLFGCVVTVSAKEDGAVFGRADDDEPDFSKIFLNGNISVTGHLRVGAVIPFLLTVPQLTAAFQAVNGDIFIIDGAIFG